MSTWSRAARRAGFPVLSLLVGCGSAAKPVDAPAPIVDAGPPPPMDAGAPVVVDAGPPPIIDAGPPAAPKVKVENIGMHVGGGPFDEATKEPFRKAVAPRHPEMGVCWAQHVTKQKPFDVGVDLLIEGAGGHPKVSNPRVHFNEGEEDGHFVDCLFAVFESVDFPKLDRGKSGVSYSLRFTPTP